MEVQFYFALQHTPQPSEGARVARLDLDEHLVEKSPPELGTSLDEAKVVRPEEHDPEITRQINCPAPRAVDLDRASGPITFDVQSYRDLSTQRAGLDLGLDARTWSERANELQLPSRPRRARERQHRDRLEEIGLALAVGADEDVDHRSRREVQLAVIAMVSEFETAKAHLFHCAPMRGPREITAKPLISWGLRHGYPHGHDHV